MTDAQIVASIQNRDETAIVYAMNRYSKLLWSIIGAVLSRAADLQEAEECVADVFVYLWEHPERYDPGRGSLKTWLCLIARSRAVDRYRKLTQRTVLSLDDVQLAEALVSPDAPAQSETRGILASAVCALGEPDREILIRRYCYEQKPKAIALALGLPVKQVENRLYRTKARLRETLTAER